MIYIQVLGTGCPKCRQLAAVADEAARALGVEVVSEKVTDINEILSFGVMSTPALVVNGKVACSGRVPALEDVKRMLQQAEAGS